MFESSLGVLLSHEKEALAMFGDTSPQLSMIREQKAKFVKLKRLAMKYVRDNADSLYGLELCKPDPERPLYCALLPQPDANGGARLVFFNAECMYSHVGFNSPEEALENAFQSGFVDWAKGTIDRFVLTRSWRKAVTLASLPAAPFFTQPRKSADSTQVG